MVVIKETVSTLSSQYGKNFISRIQSFSSIIGYTVEIEDGEIKVEFNPDRPDLFSFATLSHSIGIYEGEYSWKPLSFGKGGIPFNIDPSVRKLRPLVVGFHCRGKAIGNNFRDLIDFQERIHLSIGKNREKVSIGIHDLKRVSPPITYHPRDMNSLRFTTYDGIVSGSVAEILSKHPKGREYGHLIQDSHQVPVIEDSRNEVLSMPPVVNGNVSVVTENTKEFFVDLTGRDRKALREAFFLLAYFFRDLGYEILLSNVTDLGDQLHFDGRSVRIEHDLVKRLTGVRVPEDDIPALLAKMGYSARTVGRGIEVMVPGNRTDVMGPADIIEDIAKAYGYDNISPARPLMNVVGTELPLKPFISSVRYLMLGLGFQETMSYVVTTQRFYDGTEYHGDVQIQNPKSREFSIVRDSLYPGILEFLRINKRRNLPQSVFEIGDVIEEGEQRTHMCSAIISSRSGFSGIKQVLDALLPRLGINGSRIEHTDFAPMIDGRSGAITVEGKYIGLLGEIHPETLDRYELKNPVSLIEIDLGVMFSILYQGSG